MILGVIAVAGALVFLGLVLYGAGYITLPWERGKRG